MITVHHLDHSRAHRVLWLLEELSQSYEIKEYKRNQNLRAPDALKKVHPLGKSPVITDSETGQTMAESGAILEYLIDRFDKKESLRPKALSSERWQYNYWLHYAEGSLMPQLFLALLFEIIKEKTPLLLKPVMNGFVSAIKGQTYGPELKRHAAFIEAHLSTQAYFAGPEFSAADIQMSYPLEAAIDRVPEFHDSEIIQSYIKRLKKRPAYQHALGRGGPVALPKS